MIKLGARWYKEDSINTIGVSKYTWTPHKWFIAQPQKTRYWLEIFIKDGGPFTESLTKKEYEKWNKKNLTNFGKK